MTSPRSKTHTRVLVGIALAGGLLAFGVTSALSQPPGHGGFGHHGGPHGGGPEMAMFLLHHLDLGDDQEAQIDALVAAGKESAEAQFQALEAARKALHEMVLTGTYSEAAAEPQVQAIATASGELARMHAKLGSEIAKILTPEQRAELAEDMAKMERHHHS